MFDIVNTSFSYETQLIVYSFLQDLSKGKRSSLQLIYNAHTAFLLSGACRINQLQYVTVKMAASTAVKEKI